MKKILLPLILFSFIIVRGYSQESMPSYRYIEVVGSAEKEVDVDSFLFSITICEYINEKDGNKVPINVVENELLQILRDAGIDGKRMNVSGIGNLYREKGDKDYFITKTVNVTLEDTKKLNEILKKVNTQSVSYMQLRNFANKNILSHKKQLRIAALHAAREKAGYLLDSIDKELGDVISVIERGESDNGMYRSMKVSNDMLSNGFNEDSAVDALRKIKITYEIKASFEIK